MPIGLKTSLAIVLFCASSTPISPFLVKPVPFTPSIRSLPPTPRDFIHRMGVLLSTIQSLTKPILGEEDKEEEDWHVEAEKLKEYFVDDWYHTVPVRFHTVQVAKEYAASPNATANCNFGVFPGVHKYLGGAKDGRDGCIYGIPSHARSLICLYPDDSDIGNYKVRIDPLPKHVADINTKFKWLRGIIAHGYLYGIPAWADSVLQVDIDAMWGRRKLPPGQTSFINLIPLPAGHQVQQWQWHGAAMDKDQKAIYAIPSNADKVLKVDLTTHVTSLIEIDIDKKKYPSFDMNMTNKWYGGIPGNDNAVYGMPYRTCAVLRIDTETDTACLVGPDHGCQLYNWHGGLKCEATGMIYAFPSHADTALKIDTTLESKGQKCTLLDIHRAPYDVDKTKNYKWLGGAHGADGNIYAMPADTSSILKINVTNDYCSTFGSVGTSKNKWQGGVVARDDAIYAIPANGEHVLRIDTSPQLDPAKDNPVQLLGNLPKRKDKWQGAFIGNDGAMYAIPEGGYRILKVTPSSSQETSASSTATTNGGQAPTDVNVEML